MTERHADGSEDVAPREAPPRKSMKRPRTEKGVWVPVSSPIFFEVVQLLANQELKKQGL